MGDGPGQESGERTANALSGTPSAEQLLLGGEPRYTRVQCAERAGVGVERAGALWRSLGFATPGDDEIVFTDADVDALRAVAGLRNAGVGDVGVELSLTRAMGQAMARLTEWQVGMLRELVVADADAADREVTTESGLAAAAALIPGVERLQRYVWRRHLLAASNRMVASGTGPGETAPLAVGFADVAGFTSLSRGLAEARLDEFLEAFEASASSVVIEHGGRVIKNIGDEIMFTADSARDAADIGLGLAERISALDGRPDLHVGLAYGPVLHRLGDVYGTVVNLASRLTALAQAGTVLVDRELAAAIGDEPGFRVKRLRRVSVRGFSHLQPWLLRRGEGEEMHTSAE
ncbi:MAG TPA: adenylate/guanylate cyclase domain-containing protein [Pseudonocardia sp.]